MRFYLYFSANYVQLLNHNDELQIMCKQLKVS